MTITEDLEFSVLTAPVASLDRRALSQAWYSALYGNAAQPGQTPLAPRDSRNARSAPQLFEGKPPSAVQQKAERAAPVRVRNGKVACAGQVERRAPRSALARKIERTFLHPCAVTRKASFAIDGAQGRVQVLLQRQGSRIKLVAICPVKARAEVATALAQARYALALRGIELDAQMRGEAAC